jgi:carotenoid 1,2-hydratase
VVSFPAFARPVPPRGYAWWYIDALSTDGRHGLAIIALIGSVFSPYYARARRRGTADPLNHCALNVALYGAGGKRWSMTERGHGAVQRTGTWLQIGPSTLFWDGQALTTRIDEITFPLPGRVRGVVRVHPVAVTDQVFDLDAEGRHRWQPIAPRARVEVRLTRPSLRWTGSGYFDSNQGDTPLEDAFVHWDWSRSGLQGGDTAVLYDVSCRGGKRRSLALRFDSAAEVRSFDPPPSAPLPPTRWWRIGRKTQADGSRADVLETLEDTPFYARSLLASQLFGERTIGIHESLSLDRFRRREVQWLLPFRMPRVGL